jgi:hypothetical protein
MRVEAVRPFDRDDLLEALRNTRLRGFGAPLIYGGASLELISVDTCDLAPAQRYVLKLGVRQALELREELLRHGVDLFALEGGAFLRTADSPDQEIPVIPPIVEESHEPDGRAVLLINDGLHRVFAARSRNLPITVVVARDVPPEYPYYAYALPRGWSDVAELEDLPDEFQKKDYRLPDHYKALFRDFNAVFPGVQKQRKRSNPTCLRAEGLVGGDQRSAEQE